MKRKVIFLDNHHNQHLKKKKNTKKNGIKILQEPVAVVYMQRVRKDFSLS